MQDYGNRTADTFLAMPELGRWGILSPGGSYFLYGLDLQRQSQNVDIIVTKANVCQDTAHCHPIEFSNKFTVLPNVNDP